MAEKIVNPGIHPDQSLVACNDISPLQEPLDIDKPESYCPDDPTADPSQKHVSPPAESWLEDVSNKKTGLGQHAQCDPMQTGQILNDLQQPNRNTIYRYSKALRGCDEAILDLFRDLVVIDEDGKAHPVPIVWATQERAVAHILQDNVRKDNSGVVDRIRLPILACHNSSITFAQDRYIYHKALDYMRRYRDDLKPGFTIKENTHDRDTVFGVARGIPIDVGYQIFAWTFYLEDMNQILEQMLLKFSPIAYIRVRGVAWETIVKLDSIANNLNVEPGDQDVRVIKFEFNLTAQTYIPQPIVRKKTVLKMNVDIHNSVKPNEVTETLARLEEAIEELKE